MSSATSTDAADSLTEVTTQAADHARLASLLSEARSRAMRGDGRVLVSLVERAPALDPLAILESFASRSTSDPALAVLFEQGSMYWNRGADAFSLAGLGAVATIACDGVTRFELADTQWSALVRDAIVDDNSGEASGVGPTLVGGFAFEPGGHQSEDWRGFLGAHLIVPRLLISSVAGQSWLTISALVGSDGEPDADADSLLDLLRAVAGSGDIAGTESSSDVLNADLALDDRPAAARWCDSVSEAVKAIGRGEFEKVVLARAVHVDATNDIDPYETLRQLREANPNAFVFGYWRGTRAFVGASPERLIRLDGRSVQATSLAGTAKRGATTAEDGSVASALLASAKDRAEHAVVLRSLKEVLDEFCDDVTAASEPSLLTMPNVHHLQTEVRAELRAGNSLLKIAARLHPTPAVGGSPREAALRFIHNAEDLDRGWYAGPIGWIGRDSGELAVALRSAILYGSEAMLFAGCGIVAESDPDLEFAESLLKLQPMKSAIAAALAASPSDSTSVAGANRS